MYPARIFSHTYIERDKTTTTMNQTKKEFQRICIELESALEEYKNRYPKNLGQIIRFHTASITILTGLFLCATAFLSMIPNYTVFAVLASFGGRFFLAAIRSVNDETEDDGKKYKQRVKDFGSRVSESIEGYKTLTVSDKKGIAKIEDAMAQLESFAEYPDVENYCKGFIQQVNEVTKRKIAVREKYSKFRKYGLWTMGIILVVLFVRAGIIVNMAK